MPSPIYTFNIKMNALAASINTKGGSTGKKDLDELKAAVDSLPSLPKLFAPRISYEDPSSRTEINAFYNENGDFYTDIVLKFYYDGHYAKSVPHSGDGPETLRISVENVASGTSITVTCTHPNFLESDPSDALIR